MCLSYAVHEFLKTKRVAHEGEKKMKEIKLTKAVKGTDLPFETRERCYDRGYGDFYTEYYVDSEKLSESQKRLALLLQPNLWLVEENKILMRDCPERHIRVAKSLAALNWIWEKELVPAGLESIGWKCKSWEYWSNDLAIRVRALNPAHVVEAEGAFEISFGQIENLHLKDMKFLSKECFSSTGKRLESDYDREMRAAMPPAPPEGVPIFKLQRWSHGTTVTLNQSEDSVVASLNCIEVWGEDEAAVEAKFSGRTECSWTRETNGYVRPDDPRKWGACLVFSEGMQEYEDSEYFVLYSPKLGWVRLSSVDEATCYSVALEKAIPLPKIPKRILRFIAEHISELDN